MLQACFLPSSLSVLHGTLGRPSGNPACVRRMRRRRAMKPSSIRPLTDVGMRQANSTRRHITLALSLALVLLASTLAFYAVRLGRQKASLSTVKDIEKETSVNVENSDQTGVDLPAPVFKIEVLGEYAHDSNAFTQGLAFADDGFLYESTGRYGQSQLRRTEVSTGNVVHSVHLPDRDFGEGLTLASHGGSQIVQVLWKVGRGYVYDRANLRRLSTFSVGGEAWGIAQTAPDSDEFYLSDGSSSIQVFALRNGAIQRIRRFTVYDAQHPVGLLNELEVVNGELWANIFMADFIARIDVDSGIVKSWLDLRGILDESHIPKGHHIDVLNGIAHNPKDDVVYITGKLWPKLYSMRPTSKRSGNSIRGVIDPFFLDPSRVEYVHRYMIA